ncbi:uncharacterized protein LOC115318955 [Ixodes scapularis]|uniref:uncharacterized protein LOC115318955 n=1 Tax=Ixodes scapularis TaxID=6945 RepID=UPI001A9E6FED|nr:uncharacterized protein LOC115318955 [Ixodes scapularis]
MERVRTKRTSRRAQTTRLIHEVRATLANEGHDLSSLTTLLQRLTTNIEELKILDREFESFVSDEHIEQEYEAVMTYQDNSTQAFAMLSHRIEILKNQEARVVEVNRTPAILPTTTENARTRLPKLEMLKFDGSTSQWQAFWDMFQNRIDQHPQLCQADKFHYLRSLLTGPAFRAIAGLHGSNSSYTDALAILRARFGDKKLIEQDHLSKLRTLQKVPSSNDVGALRRLLDAVQLHIRGLKDLGVHAMSYSAMLNEILMKVLPTDVVIEYHRRKSFSGATEPLTSEGDLEMTLKFLQIEVECRERSGLTTGRTSQDSRPDTRKYDSRREGTRSSAAVLHSRAKESADCLFCSSRKHSSEDCNTDATIDAKKKKLSDDMRCFKCTMKGHRARDCRRRIVCNTCKGRHATSMCDPRWQRTKETEQNSKTKALHTYAPSTTQKEPHILLQTFRGWIAGKSGYRYIRGMIDGGSQRTFIREDVSKRYQLRILGDINICINTFGSEAAKEQRRKLVEVRLKSQYHQGVYIFEAVEVPNICSQMMELPLDHPFIGELQSQGKDLADLCLFDETKGALRISLLIGADQVWKIMKGDNIRSESQQLTALSTRLGWTVQGPTDENYSLTTQNHVMACILNAGVTTEDETNKLPAFWDLEHLGITDKEDRSQETVLQTFEDSICWTEGRYEVSLPWKPNKRT